MISRRSLLIATACMTLSRIAGAQHAVPRIACIGPPTVPPLVEFLGGLRELGYVDGVTMRWETRWAPAEDRPHLDQVAKELVMLGVDVIATLGTPATEAALAATERIPIVMVAVGDPVRSGFAKSLARPGRNVTGVSVFTNELAAKQFEVLRDLVPLATRIAVLWNPANAGARDLVGRFEHAARGRAVSVTRFAASRPEELETALAPLASRRFHALFVHAETMFLAERQKILGRVAASRVPALYGNPAYVDEGGLASYAHDVAHTSRRAAALVDKILKGARPADLPIEEPTRFELRINVKTAKALGIAIPESVLQRADRVIE